MLPGSLPTVGQSLGAGRVGRRRGPDRRGGFRLRRGGRPGGVLGPQPGTQAHRKHRTEEKEAFHTAEYMGMVEPDTTCIDNMTLCCL